MRKRFLAVFLLVMFSACAFVLAAQNPETGLEEQEKTAVENNAVDCVRLNLTTSVVIVVLLAGILITQVVILARKSRGDTSDIVRDLDKQSEYLKDLVSKINIVSGEHDRIKSRLKSLDSNLGFVKGDVEALRGNQAKVKLDNPAVAEPLHDKEAAPDLAAELQEKLKSAEAEIAELRKQLEVPGAKSDPFGKLRAKLAPEAILVEFEELAAGLNADLFNDPFLKSIFHYVLTIRELCGGNASREQLIAVFQNLDEVLFRAKEKDTGRLLKIRKALAPVLNHALGKSEIKVSWPEPGDDYNESRHILQHDSRGASIILAKSAVIEFGKEHKIIKSEVVTE